MPEVIDVWFDSGAMPFAQRHALVDGEAGLERALPGRLHLRGARPDARLVLLAARRLDAAARSRGPLPQRRLPGPDPRQRGSEDVEVQGQRRRARGRSSTGTAPTRCAGTSSPPSSRGTATCSRPRRSARACGCSCASCGTRTASRRCTSRRRTRRGDAQTDLDRWIRSRLSATVEVVTDRLENYDATMGGRAIADFVDDLSNWYVRRSRPRFWEGDPVALETLRHCLVTSPSCSRRSRRSSPTRSTTTSTAASRAST